MSKRTSRRVRKNRYILVRNRRSGGLRRLVRNVSIGGVDLFDKILLPALGATGGMVLAQWVSQKLAQQFFAGQDPRLVATGASFASALAAYSLGEQLGLSPETQAAVAAGAGVSGLKPWLPLQLVEMSVAAQQPGATAAQGYYTPAMLGLGAGYMIDISHAGAPYRGMLGLGNPDFDESAYSDYRHPMKAMSMVTPIDAAWRAPVKKAVRKVRERMETPGDRGWAGGSFSRDLFSAGPGP